MRPRFLGPDSFYYVNVIWNINGLKRQISDEDFIWYIQNTELLRENEKSGEQRPKQYFVQQTVFLFNI